MKNYLFLDGIFNEETIASFKSHSVATNKWLKNFSAGLRANGNLVTSVGCVEERIWPFGRLMVYKSSCEIDGLLSGSGATYLNAPVFRRFSKKISLRYEVEKIIKSSNIVPDYVVTFSCLNNFGDTLPSFEVAKQLKKIYGATWICIVGDGPPPVGADVYVYHNWANYQLHHPSSGKAIHLDGGVDELAIQDLGLTKNINKIFLYSGALSIHGGAIELVDEFSKIDDASCRLWLTGRGGSKEFLKRVSEDNRIKLLGFLSEDELIDVGRKADFFINPRPTTFTPNLHNFPSKLFFYLAFEKPVLSTFTPGMSPEYENILIRMNEFEWADSIERVLNLSDAEICSISQNIKKFKVEHSWNNQAKKLCDFLSLNYEIHN